MTTSYSSTIDVTSPNTSLDSIYVAVGGATCINMHGSGTGFSLTNSELASSPDSLLLNQMHSALPGMHVVNTKIHHCTHGFSYGTHGIYDKGQDSLVERCESWDIAGGQCYSIRWPNRYYQCIARNTGAAFGHFNYGTQNGTVKIRECIAFGITDFVFYSEGVWYDNSDNVLGQSTVIMEIDHCTFDVTNCPGYSLDFSQCHADQYVTNCVIISNQTLSQIIRQPNDGHVVHTQGTVVLTPSQATTWLTAAPNYVPIAGSGSPIIGLAVASPSASLALWGNLPTIGAIQAAGGGGGGGGGGTGGTLEQYTYHGRAPDIGAVESTTFQLERVGSVGI